MFAIDLIHAIIGGSGLATGPSEVPHSFAQSDDGATFHFTDIEDPASWGDGGTAGAIWLEVSVDTDTGTESITLGMDDLGDFVLADGTVTVSAPAEVTLEAALGAGTGEGLLADATITEAAVPDPTADFAGVTGGLYRISEPTLVYRPDGGTDAEDVAQDGEWVGRLMSAVAGGYDLQQASSAARPLLDVDANGRRWIVFDGVDDKLSNTAFPHSVARTLVFSGYVPDPVNGRHLFGWHTHGCLVVWGGNWAWRSNTDAGVVDSGVSCSTAAVVSVRIQSNGAGEMRINGVQRAAWTNFATANDGFAFGARNPGDFSTYSSLTLAYASFANVAFDDTKLGNQETVAAHDAGVTM